MKCTRLVLLLVFLTLLCTTDLVLAQRISKKILTEGEGKFNAPITVGKGMPFSITFNEIEIIVRCEKNGLICNMERMAWFETEK